ncbi:hypothetical protein QBC45DRAFT_354299, partial [Copromyces sp. CBS 386.78]
TPQIGTSWAHSARLVPSRPSPRDNRIVAFHCLRLSEHDPLPTSTNPELVTGQTKKALQPAHPLAPRFSGRRDT